MDLILQNGIHIN